MVELLVSETSRLPKPLLLRGNMTLSLWGFTLHSSGAVTQDLKGNGPYVHAMKTVSRGLVAMDQLKALHQCQAISTLNWWPGGAIVVSTRDTNMVSQMITFAERLSLEYSDASMFGPQVLDFVHKILDIRHVAASDPMLIVRATQRNTTGVIDINPFRNSLGLYTVQQQLNTISPLYMALFLKVCYNSLYISNSHTLTSLFSLQPRIAPSVPVLPAPSYTNYSSSTCSYSQQVKFMGRRI